MLRFPRTCYNFPRTCYDCLRSKWDFLGRFLKHMLNSSHFESNFGGLMNFPVNFPSQEFLRIFPRSHCFIALFLPPGVPRQGPLGVRGGPGPSTCELAGHSKASHLCYRPATSYQLAGLAWLGWLGLDFGWLSASISAGFWLRFRLDLGFWLSA